jgi:hypothetical protein
MAFSLTRIGQLVNPGEYLNGAAGVATDGDYAYVVSKDDDALVVIDISTKSTPTRVGQITGGGNYLNFARGIAMVVQGNYVYVVSKDSDAFVIINVSTKTSPTREGQLFGAGEYLNEPDSVAVDGDYAYVTGNLSGSLVVIDISNKSSPTRVGQITGAGNYLTSPRGVAVQGNYVFVTSSTQNSLAIFDVSTKSSPSFVGEIHTASGQYLDGARGVFVNGNYAYVASYDYNGLAIINISNKSNPTHAGSVTGSLGGAFSVTMDRDYAYVAAQSGDRLTAIDVSNKTSPSVKYSISGSGNYLDGAQGVFVEGYYAYVASGVSDAFVVISITPDPSDIPTNIICTPGEELNTITWDSVISADEYNIYWMKYEYFNDEFTSLDGWNIIKDVGTETIQISSDKLYMSNTVGTGCHVTNKNNLPAGNFDIQIDLITYTPDDNSNGFYAWFKVLDQYPMNLDGAEIYYYISSAGAQHNIISNLWINGVQNNTPITISSQATKLRITRVGTIVNTYYYISSWILVDTQDFSSRASNLNLVTIDGTQNSGNGGISEWDNFNYYVDVKTFGTKIADITSPYEHSSLDGGDNYIYIVTGENPGGESDASEIVNGVPTVAPPEVPAISGTGEDSQNNIHISECHNAISYNIYWGLAPGITKENGTKIENATLVDCIYEHINLIIQNYYYVATSESGIDESDISNEICLKPDFEGKIFNHNEQIENGLLYQYRDI